MRRDFLKEALEEYSTPDLPPNPDLWPAVQAQILAQVGQETPGKARSKRKSHQSLALRLGLASFGIVLLVAVGAAGLNLLNFTGGSVAAVSSLIIQTQSQTPDKDQLDNTRQIIEKRLALLGVSPLNVTLLAQDTLKIEAGGVKDQTQLRAAATTTGRVEFIDAGLDNLTYGQVVKTSYCTKGSLYNPRPNLCNAKNSSDAISTKLYQTVITGEQLDPAKVAKTVDQKTEVNRVQFGIKPEAAATMKKFTDSNIGKQMAITFDGKVISSGTIQGVISNSGTITNDEKWTTASGKAEVDLLILVLKTGALPVEVKIEQPK